MQKIRKFIYLLERDILRSYKKKKKHKKGAIKRIMLCDIKIHEYCFSY